MQAASLDVLEKAKFPPEQARALAQAIEIELVAQRDVLATKADLHQLELKIVAMKTELVRWVFRCILGQTAMLLGAAYFFVTRLR